MNRIVLFANVADVATKVLLPRILQEIDSKNDAMVVALFLEGDVHEVLSYWHFWKNRMIRSAQVILGSGRSDKAVLVPPISSRRIIRKYGFPVYRLPGNDPNHSNVLHIIKNSLDADLAINIYCRKLFRQPLLGSFKKMVNYHNGFLPRYRGLGASNWSIYMGETRSGYSFHLMSNKFDTGNILGSGEVSIGEEETPADLERRKAIEAANGASELLDTMIDGQLGDPQLGMGCMHNRQSNDLMVQVATPSSLSRDEWERRLKAFLRINTCLHNRWYSVTGISPCKGPGKLAFCCKDGDWMQVTSVNFWPVWVKMSFRRT
ncbi:MAG: formyltransferase family protein [Pseudomonadales bacterium]